MHLFTWTRETLVHETSLSKTDPPLREGGREGERRRERERKKERERRNRWHQIYTHSVINRCQSETISHKHTHTHIQTKIPSLMECNKQFKKEASSAVCDSHINTVAIVYSSQTRPVYPLSLSLGDYQTIITHRIGQWLLATNINNIILHMKLGLWLHALSLSLSLSLSPYLAWLVSITKNSLHKTLAKLLPHLSKILPHLILRKKYNTPP